MTERMTVSIAPSAKPSRPLRSSSRPKLEDNRPPILPKHRPHHIRNLPHRRIALHRIQNMRHQIPPTPRRPLHAPQSRRMHPRVPPSPQRPHPFHLPRLQRLIDPLNRHRHLFAHELIHPNDNRFLLIHRPLVSISSILNLTLHIPAFNRPQHAILSTLIKSRDRSHILLRPPLHL